MPERKLDAGLSPLANDDSLHHPAQQVVLQDYIHSVHDAEERIARLTKQIEDLVPTW
jgi:uncharacterized small protein (DUF1192 family)